MPIPPVIEGLRDRPGMFVTTTSYDTVVAFLTGYDIALLGGRVAFEQAASVVFQPFAAQPGRAGQVVPIKMQAGERQALVERVFDLDRGSALVIGATGVQRLVDIGDQMH